MLLPFEICMFLPFDQNRVEKAGYALEVTSFKLNEGFCIHNLLGFVQVNFLLANICKKKFPHMWFKIF